MDVSISQATLHQDLLCPQPSVGYQDILLLSTEKLPCKTKSILPGLENNPSTRKKEFCYFFPSAVFFLKMPHLFLPHWELQSHLSYYHLIFEAQPGQYHCRQIFYLPNRQSKILLFELIANLFPKFSHFQMLFEQAGCLHYRHYK